MLAGLDEAEESWRKVLGASGLELTRLCYTVHYAKNTRKILEYQCDYNSS